MAKEVAELPSAYQILKWKWSEVSLPLVIAAWILIACVGKLVFNLWRKLAESFPDSALLIILGLLLGLILFYVSTKESIQLSSRVFFLYLLPPIVFDAGYFMPNRAFFDNFGTILVYAVIGTLWNTVAIGMSLWGAQALGLFTLDIAPLNIMLFSSLISAVDPVAVLCVFEEVHVNEVLYITVFGESLLNDAVTVVLYQIFIQFSEISTVGSIAVTDVIGGILSFFIVGIGGVIVGVLYAALVSFITRWTGHVKMLNPLFVFLVPYCAYLTAELLSLSAIMAIVFCGICMKQYVKANIGNNARIAIRYMVKAASCSAEAIIFMFLGLSFFTSLRHSYWDLWFIVLTLVFCLVYRAIGVFVQTYFLNKSRVRHFDLFDQFIMAYGGLRGAVAYGLAVAIGHEVSTDVVDEDTQKLFVITCECVIFFTVFIQGATIKPLVNLLNIERQDHREKSLTESIFERVCGNCMAGVEDICGLTGHHWLRHRFDYYNTKYLKPILQRHLHYGEDMKIVQSYHKFVDADIRMKAASEASSNARSPESGITNVAYEATCEIEDISAPSTAREHVHFHMAEPEEIDEKAVEFAMRRPLSGRRMSRYYLNDEESRHDLDEFRLLRHRRKGSSQNSQQHAMNGAAAGARWKWKRRPTAYDINSTLTAQNKKKATGGADPSRSLSVHDRPQQPQRNSSSEQLQLQRPNEHVSAAPVVKGITKSAHRASAQSGSGTSRNVHPLNRITEGEELKLRVTDRPTLTMMDSMDDPFFKPPPPTERPPPPPGGSTVAADASNAELYDDVLQHAVLPDDGSRSDSDRSVRVTSPSHFVKHKEQQLMRQSALAAVQSDDDDSTDQATRK